MLDLILCDRLNELLRTAFRTRAQKQMLYEMFYIFKRVIMGLGGCWCCVTFFLSILGFCFHFAILTLVPNHLHILEHVYVNIKKSTVCNCVFPLLFLNEY